MFKRLAVSETLRLHNSNTLCICSHLTLSADIGLSGGGGLSPELANSAFVISLASAGFAR